MERKKENLRSFIASPKGVPGKFNAYVQLFLLLLLLLTAAASYLKSRGKVFFCIHCTDRQYLDLLNYLISSSLFAHLIIICVQWTKLVIESKCWLWSWILALVTLPLYSWGCRSRLAAHIKVGSENARRVCKYDPVWVWRGIDGTLGLGYWTHDPEDGLFFTPLSNQESLVVKTERDRGKGCLRVVPETNLTQKSFVKIFTYTDVIFFCKFRQTVRAIFGWVLSVVLHAYVCANSCLVSLLLLCCWTKRDKDSLLFLSLSFSPDRASVLICPNSLGCRLSLSLSLSLYVCVLLCHQRKLRLKSLDNK